MPMPDSRWLTSAEAAAILSVSPQQVRYLARQGHFGAERVGKQWRFDTAGVQAEANDRQLWVSYLQAAELTGSDHHAVWRAVQAGEIEGRDVHRSRPSLLRSAVLEWGERRASRLAQEARIRDESGLRRQQRQAPPNDGHVWLDRETAALVLGVSPSWVQKLSSAGRLPCARVGGSRRLWFRRDHVEQVQAAWVARKIAGGPDG